MKKIYRDLIISSVVISTSTTIIVPVAITQTNQYKNISIQNNSNNTRYRLGDQVFNSKQELVEYAKEVVDKSETSVDVNSVWSIQTGNNIQFFNNPSELLNTLLNKVKSMEVQTSDPLIETVDGEILESDFGKLTPINDNNDTPRMTVYRGKDNQTFATELEAKESYLTVHDAYYFDGIYFRSKEELKTYVERNLNKYSSGVDKSNENFVILAPNGYYSKTIKYNDLEKKQTKKYIKQFLENNTTKYLEAKDKDGLYRYYLKDNIINNPADAISTVDSFSYVSLDTNQGKSNYVVDLDKADPYNLYGPYYIQAPSTIKQMQNRSNWKKVDYTESKFVTNQAVADLINSFISTLISDIVDLDQGDNPETKDSNKKYPFLLSSRQEEEKNYFDQLKKQYPKIYNKTIILTNKLKSGKRFNKFLLFPILYTNIIEELVLSQDNQNMIDLTRKVFNNVSKEIDLQLRRTFHKSILLRKGTTLQKPEVFSVEKLFGFNKNNFNLNVDVESYVDYIKDDYPRLYRAMKFTSSMSSIATMSAHLAPGSEHFVREVYNKFFIEDIQNEDLELYTNIWSNINARNEDDVLKGSKDVLESNGLDPNNYQNISSFYVNNLTNITTIDYSIEQQLKMAIKDIDSGQSINKDNIFSKLNSYSLNSIISSYKQNNINIKNILLKVLSGLMGITEEDLQNKLNHLYDEFINVIDFVKQIGSKIMGKLKLIEEGLSKVWPFLDLALNIYKDFKNFFLQVNMNAQNNMFYKLFKGLLKAAEILTTGIPLINLAIKAVNLILYVVENIYKELKNCYEFNCEGVKYIWNGGRTDSWFFGLINIETSSILNMKLIGPLEINKEHFRTQYFYKNKKYDDLNELKIQQLIDILNDSYSNENLKMVYAFDKLNKSYSARPDNAFSTFEELNNIIIDDIKFKRGKYSRNDIYDFAGGFTFDKTIAVDAIPNEIVGKIKPVKIIPLPTLINNKPVCSNSEEDDGSIPPYSLPGQYWTPKEGLIQNDNLNSFLIYNPNVKEGIITKTFSQYTKKFFSSFDVDKKVIIKTDFNTKRKFSDYSENIVTRKIYYAKNRFNQTKVFDSLNSVLNWLLQQNNYKVYAQSVKNITYKLGDKSFDTFQSYLDFIMSNTTII